MTLPLMPKATAVWLVENTVLTFEQIAAFCGMHPLEVQAIADGEVAVGMLGLDPLSSGQLTQAEIDRCAADPDARLTMAPLTIPQLQAKARGARYTPVSKRQDRPDAISWLLKNYPELGDAQISKLIGTTKPTINAVRDKTHWNSPNIKQQNPVGLGLCSEADLEKSVNLARARAGTVHATTPSESAAKPAEKAAVGEAGGEAPAAAPRETTETLDGAAAPATAEQPREGADAPQPTPTQVSDEAPADAPADAPEEKPEAQDPFPRPRPSGE